MLGLGNSIITSGALDGEEFSPSNISSLIHWYKHEEGLEESDGTFPEDGEQITAWGDQKGSEDLTATEYWPIWNDTEKALNAAGANKKLKTSGDISLTTFSMYVRVKLQAISSSDIFVQDTSDAGMFFRINSSTAIKMKIGGSAISWAVATLNTGQYYTIGVERDDADAIRCYIDGVEYTQAVTTGVTYTFDAIKCSQDDFFKTALIFNNALSGDDRAALETYLSNI